MSDRNDGGPSDDRHWTVEQTQEHITRRRLLSGIGVAGASTAALSIVATDTASAAVELGTLDAQSATFTGASAIPVLDATVRYEYSVSKADTTIVELSVGDSVVASEEQMTALVGSEGSTTLSGRVTDSDAWTESDFDAPTNGSVTRDVSVSVRFAVLSGGSVVASDTASATLPITVDNSGAEPQIRVGATVSVSNAESE